MSDYIKNFTKKVSEFPKGLAVIFRAEQKKTPCMIYQQDLKQATSNAITTI